MGRKLQLIVSGILFLLLGFTVSGQALVPYDDFSGQVIDPQKWLYQEFVREIRDGKLVCKVTAYDITEDHNLNFKNPSLINYMEAEVTLHVLEGNYDQGNTNLGAKPFAGLSGRFYNDGSGIPGSMVGDVQADLRLVWWRGQISAEYRVRKSDGTNLINIHNEVFTLPISLEQIYKLSIDWNASTHIFAFKVNNEIKTWSSADSSFNGASSPWKAIANNAGLPSVSGFWSKVSASFDNVIAKNSAGTEIVNDTFSSTPLSGTNWALYESVREIEGGKLRLKYRAKDFTSSVSLVSRFKQSDKVKEYQANVSLSEFQTINGSNLSARLVGYFYNDTENLNNGYEGEVFAQLRIGGTGTTPIASWYVGRMNDASGSAFTQLGYGTLPLPNPIALSAIYTLYLKWDGVQFSFKIKDSTNNEATGSYTALTSNFPSNIKNKYLEVKIYPPSSYLNYDALISATFDDVMTNVEFLYLPLILRN